MPSSSQILLLSVGPARTFSPCTLHHADQSSDVDGTWSSCSLIFPRGPHYATIDFQNAKALRALTETLLKHDFKLDVKLPEDRLCPAVSKAVVAVDL